MSVSVRRAFRDDIDRIIEIERSWIHLSHWSIDAYYRLLEEPGLTSSVVAEVDESGPEAAPIVGFVIFHVADRVSEIYNIAVESDHARLGVGSALMRHVLERSRQRGARKVMLEVRKSNRNAIRFYEKFKFGVTGERYNYYSNPVEDAFVMEKDLRIGK